MVWLALVALILHWLLPPDAGTKAGLWVRKKWILKLMKPRMFYFGPWDHAGHYFFDEHGRSVREDRESGFPFGHEPGKIAVDGCLQPGCPNPNDRLRRRTRPEVEGEALLHHIQGWTALCFWDRSVDKRGACNSNYFAEGTFTFEEMVEMAQTRFAYRWNKMSFTVQLADYIAFV